jgi:hypothetical protein
MFFGSIHRAGRSRLLSRLGSVNCRTKKNAVLQIENNRGEWTAFLTVGATSIETPMRELRVELYKSLSGSSPELG